MSDIGAVLLLPLVASVITLLIEYWVVQPFRERRKTRVGLLNEAVSEVDSLLGSQVFRLLIIPFNKSPSQVSASFLQTIGNFILTAPIVLISFILSLLVVLIALPMYVMLYLSEEFGGCKFEPSCRRYLVVAIEVHGSVKGFWLALRRLGKCSPLSTSEGYDPVPLVVNDGLGTATTLWRIGLVERSRGALVVGVVSLVFCWLSFVIFIFVASLHLSSVLGFYFGSIQIVLSVIVSIFLWALFSTVQIYLCDRYGIVRTLIVLFLLAFVLGSLSPPLIELPIIPIIGTCVLDY